ncbi:MAG: [FeFe] hydrogenase H-cluster maturation GTPase HydF [Paludibacteraceae bacterium]|nr:[FeFe] hydrogenase H-cluster maturation GTPase HydF [Paludibacteraceae bacterium]
MIRRTTIGIFGPANSGKSTLVNCLTAQQVSIVSPVAGTTTDPVSRTMEINGVGPCVFIDTPGYDDTSALGNMRVSRTKDELRKCDIAIFVIPSFLEGGQLAKAWKWLEMIRAQVPQTIVVTNDFGSGGIYKGSIRVNALTGEGREPLLEAIGFSHSKVQDSMGIVTHLVKPGDTVLLVMPVDTQAPAGRLILPQVQTIRELLDYGCSALCCTTEQMTATLAKLAKTPDLIVTDSQAFAYVFQNRPANVPLTSFSVLFARWKGDISVFIEGAKHLSTLQAGSRVLIAEACTHAPLSEDIGREKIPALIHKKISPQITFDIASGNDFQCDKGYDLIIHCGACMIGRQQMLSRIAMAKEAGVPITNYGVAIAYFNNILDKIVW